MSTLTKTINSDATIANVSSFTINSDATVGPTQSFNMLSDATVGVPSLSLNSDATIIAAPPPPPPPPPPSKFILPCGPPVDCPGFINSPVLNNSSEAPDPFLFFGNEFGGPFNPPLGRNFTADSCGQTCTSPVSQEEADLCAATLAFICQNTDPVTGQPYTGQPFFFNQAQTVTLHCPDGLPFSYTMPANLFAGTTQFGANQAAFNYAKNLAKQHEVCLSDLPTAPACLNEVYDQSIIATTQQSTVGAVWSISAGALPDGVQFIGTGSGGQFFGTPTASGTFNFTILLQLFSGDFMAKPYSITVAGFITAAQLTMPTIGVPYANRIFVQGFSIPSFAITSGTLSPGLVFNSDGTFGGTATSVSPNPFTVTVTETDDAFSPFKCSMQFFMLGTFGNITPDVFSATVSYWAGGQALDAGTYRINYINGAYKPSSLAGFQVWNYMVNNGATTSGFLPGNVGSFATQAICEAANSGRSFSFTHTGGSIGMWLSDSPYNDNVAGSPNPTFSLTRTS